MGCSLYLLEIYFFQNLAQSGFLKYISMPLQETRDKSYEVFLSYCQEKTEIDIQAEASLNRTLTQINAILIRPTNDY